MPRRQGSAAVPSKASPLPGRRTPGQAGLAVELRVPQPSSQAALPRLPPSLPSLFCPLPGPLLTCEQSLLSPKCHYMKMSHHGHPGVHPTVLQLQPPSPWGTVFTSLVLLPLWPVLRQHLCDEWLWLVLRAEQYSVLPPLHLLRDARGFRFGLLQTKLQELGEAALSGQVRPFLWLVEGWAVVQVSLSHSNGCAVVPNCGISLHFSKTSGVQHLPCAPTTLVEMPPQGTGVCSAVVPARLLCGVRTSLLQPSPAGVGSERPGGWAQGSGDGRGAGPQAESSGPVQACGRGPGSKHGHSRLPSRLGQPGACGKSSFHLGFNRAARPAPVLLLSRGGRLLQATRLLLGPLLCPQQESGRALRPSAPQDVAREGRLLSRAPPHLPREDHLLTQHPAPGHWTPQVPSPSQERLGWGSSLVGGPPGGLSGLQS